MKRDPDEGGYAHWFAKLNLFGRDFVASEMVLASLPHPSIDRDSASPSLLKALLTNF